MIELIILVLAGIGILFQLLGTISLHRFIDPYTRLHGATKCTTFGSIFIALAVIVYGYSLGETSMMLHTAVAIGFLLLTNPTGAHAIARASYKHGILPKKAVVDKLKGVLK